MSPLAPVARRMIQVVTWFAALVAAVAAAVFIGWMPPLAWFALMVVGAEAVRRTRGRKKAV